MASWDPGPDPWSETHDTIASVANEIERERRQEERWTRMKSQGINKGMQWTNEARKRGIENSHRNRRAQS